MHEKLIFEHSAPGRSAAAQFAQEHVEAAVPAALRRAHPPLLPEVSELQAVRHYTRLSQLNFSIDTHFYPLGSCTMKYNPKACNQYAMLPGTARAASARTRVDGAGPAAVPVRPAGDAEGSDGHAWRVADARWRARRASSRAWR